MVDRSREGLSVIPSPRQGGMECCNRIVVGGVNQMGRPRRVHSRVMTDTTRAHHVLAVVFTPPPALTTDCPVSEAVSEAC
jgi:phage terminase large subunit-like protein